MVSLCAKYSLCGFNFFTFLVGGAVLSLGLWLVIDKNSFIGLITFIPSEQLEEFTKPRIIEQIAYVSIAIGGSMFIVSFLGYCGALLESRIMLITYGTLLTFIVFLEVATGCVGVIFRTKAEETIKNSLKLSISQYYTNSEDADAVTLSWDKMQMGFHCCGVDNYTDYQSNEQWGTGNKIVPESCCVLNDYNKPLAPNCTSSPNEVNSFYDKGCFRAFLNWSITHWDILIASAICLAVLEILGIVLAFGLSRYVEF